MQNLTRHKWGSRGCTQRGAKGDWLLHKVLLTGQASMVEYIRDTHHHHGWDFELESNHPEPPSWLPMINWPTFTTQSHETPSGEGTGPAKAPQSYHRSQIKNTSANMVTITLAFTAHISNGERMSTQHCQPWRSNTKTSFSKPHNEQVAFNSAPFKVVDSKTGHCGQHKLLREATTTYTHTCT